jgi:hypothetical protein
MDQAQATVSAVSSRHGTLHYQPSSVALQGMHVIADALGYACEQLLMVDGGQAPLHVQVDTLCWHSRVDAVADGAAGSDAAP